VPVQRQRIVIPIPAILGGPAPVSVPVPWRKQEQTQWCWATCMQMVFLHDDPATNRTQCQLANAAFGNSGCCQSPSSSLCNNALGIYSISAEWSRYGYHSAYQDSSLSFEAIKTEISAGRPVEIGLKWTNGGGHAVLIVGFEIDGAEQLVIVNDPWRGQVNVTYIELLVAYGDGQWQWSWTGLQRN